MPLVLQKFPVGLRGFFMAILLAALMSTISAMINVTSSVVLNDFIKRYFAKNLSQKKLVRLGQAASVVAVLIGFIFSLSFTNIVTAWETMVFVVVTVILVPATLRWHYWRFSATGLRLEHGRSRPGSSSCVCSFSSISTPRRRSRSDVALCLITTVILSFLTKPARHGRAGEVLRPRPAVRFLGAGPAGGRAARARPGQRQDAADRHAQRLRDRGFPVLPGLHPVLCPSSVLEAVRNLDRRSRPSWPSSSISPGTRTFRPRTRSKSCQSSE